MIGVGAISISFQYGLFCEVVTDGDDFIQKLEQRKKFSFHCSS